MSLLENCECIIVRVVPIFVDLVYRIEPRNKTN